MKLHQKIHRKISKLESAKTEENSHHAWVVRIWKVLCEIFAQAWSSWLPKAIYSSFQLQIVHSLKRWIIDFLSFEMVYSLHHLDFRKCSKSGCYDCHQEYAPWQILFAFSPCNPDSLLAIEF